MDDHNIIELYWARKEIAIKETSIKYGGLCTRIAKNILFRLIAIFSQQVMKHIFSIMQVMCNTTQQIKSRNVYTKQ